MATRIGKAAGNGTSAALRAAEMMLQMARGKARAAAEQVKRMRKKVKAAKKDLKQVKKAARQAKKSLKAAQSTFEITKVKIESQKARGGKTSAPGRAGRKRKVPETAPVATIAPPPAAVSPPADPSEGAISAVPGPGGARP